MKIIIAGSRTVNDFAVVKEACRLSGFFTRDVLTSGELEIVSGGAAGVDYLGERLALMGRFKLKVFEAEWDKYGRAAGPIRNKQMGDYADALIAVRKDGSRGTSHMIEYMQSLGKKVYVMDI